MNVYELIILNEEWGETERYLIEFVSVERANKIELFKFDIDKKLSLYSELIARMGIIEIMQTSNDSLAFARHKYGKPYLVNDRNVYHSISHTRNAVVCGIGNCNIGVDVEKIATPYYDILNKCYHKDEIKALNEVINKERATLFYKFWTRKEAFTKFDGRGILQELNEINTIKKDDYFTWLFDGYCCSVYCEGSKEFNIKKITEEEIKTYWMPKKTGDN